MWIGFWHLGHGLLGKVGFFGGICFSLGALLAEL
jgi:hypothetical protein